MKDLAREKRIYLAIWKKAFREKVEKLTLNLPSYSAAVSTRMSMYRTLRPYREGRLQDSELQMAADQYVLALQKEPPAVLVIPRKSAETAEALFADLGLDEMDLLTESEMESLNQVAGQLSKTEHKANPFFDRDL